MWLTISNVEFAVTSSAKETGLSKSLLKRAKTGRSDNLLST